MQYRKSKKGFTLVEIMIVVVIIGLLAAMAIPAFQKVRENSIRGTIRNDARQLASAAQQYMMEHGITQVTLSYTATSGDVGGPIGEYVNRIGKGMTTVPTALSLDATFSMGHPQAGDAIQFTAEGQADD